MGGIATECWSSEEQDGSQAARGRKKEETATMNERTKTAAAMAPLGSPLDLLLVSSLSSTRSAGSLREEEPRVLACSRKKRKRAPRALKQKKGSGASLDCLSRATSSEQGGEREGGRSVSSFFFFFLFLSPSPSLSLFYLSPSFPFFAC